MTTITLVTLLLSSVGLFVSIFALSVALHSSDRSLSKRLSGLSTSFKEAEATLDELSSQLKALRQRENMRAYRARKTGKSAALDDWVDPDDLATSESSGDGRRWVQRMNEQLARARLGVK